MFNIVTMNTVHLSPRIRPDWMTDWIDSIDAMDKWPTCWQGHQNGIRGTAVGWLRIIYPRLGSWFLKSWKL